MVVSFMIVAPLRRRRPLRAASPPLRTAPPRSDTPSRISLAAFFSRWRSCARRCSRSCSVSLGLAPLMCGRGSVRPARATGRRRLGLEAAGRGEPAALEAQDLGEPVVVVVVVQDAEARLLRGG